VYEARFRSSRSAESKKSVIGGRMRYLTFEKSGNKPKGLTNIRVLVVKENAEQILGYRVYVSR
jgi:hypothetical protein